MNPSLESVKAYCLAKPGVTATYPFGEGTLVLKVIDKMFALLSEDEKPLRLNLKCDPEDAQALRRQYTAITPGYHMNHEHWNSLILDGSLPAELVWELVDHSYELVTAKLSQASQRKLRAIEKRGLPREE